MRTRPIVVALLFVFPLLPNGSGRAAGANLDVIGSVRFAGGTDLDFSGTLAFVGSYNSYGNPTRGQGGLYVIDVADPAVPRVVGRLACPGYQDDVGVWRTTVVMGMHDSGGTTTCKPTHAGGLRIVDVSDPTAPTQKAFLPIGPGGAHTLTIVGDTGYIYSNPGGLETSAAGQRTTIVDIRDASKPTIAGTFLPPHSTGCHDINVNANATRAYCAGSNVTQIWDITDPVHPRVISEIFNPGIFFHHGAVPSDDGETLVIADEAFGAHACDGQGLSPTGALWFYDISDETLPILEGWFNPAETTGVSGLGWCTAHNFNMVAGRDWLVIGSYRGGIAVIDFSDPTLPKRIGWVIPAGANTWSAYYHNGHIFTADTARGFDVISMGALSAGGTGG